MLLQPELHQLNFQLLIGDDLLRQPAYLWILAVQQERLGHVDGTLMMWNHHGHEVPIRIATVRRAMHSLVHHVHRVDHQQIECFLGRSNELSGWRRGPAQSWCRWLRWVFLRLQGDYSHRDERGGGNGSAVHAVLLSAASPRKSNTCAGTDYGLGRRKTYGS